MTIELDDRRKALEDAFFQKENEALLEKMRQERDGEAARQALRAQSGISDESLLDALLAQGVNAESLAALSLVPVVAVAWADGKIDAAERKAVLEAAAENGLEPGQDAHKLLEGWLDTRPAERLFESWSNYASEISAGLSGTVRERFVEQILGKADKIARSAGGILGIGSVSSEERAVLDRLKAVLGE